jgi:adenine/guanine/hypoxanthine permease
VAPIPVPIGLEITAQAFRATPPKHYDAVALAFVPTVAALVLIQTKQVVAGLGKGMADLTGSLSVTYQTLLVMANGFVLTALVWSTLLVFIIERRFKAAAGFALIGAGLSLVGLIHSPFDDGRLFLPGGADSSLPMAFALAYVLIAALVASFRSGPDTPHQPPAT